MECCYQLMLISVFVDAECVVKVSIPQELLAIYLAIQHFRHFLEGRPFQVLTDHKPSH